MSPTTCRRLPGARLTVLVALAVLLGGCALAPQSASLPQPSTSETAATQSAPEPDPTNQPTPTVSLKGQLTTPDGGPMLWQTYFTGDLLKATRNGFVTATGERIPDKYITTGYCTDDAGKATRAFGSTATEIEILDLEGKALQKVPSRAASSVDCYQNRYLVIQDESGNSLYDLEADRELPTPDDTSQALDYALAYAAGEIGYPVLDSERNLWGYKGFDGKWLHEPEWPSAEPFRDGEAAVTLVGRCHAIIDESFQQLNECLDYEELSPQGYRAENAAGQQKYFTSEYRAVTDWLDEAPELAGSYLRIPGQSKWIDLFGGPPLTLPEGFTPLSSLFGISPDGRRAYSVAAQQVVEIPQDLSDCWGDLALTCSTDTHTLVILTASGKVIDYADLYPQWAPEAVGGGYLWITVGRYQGLLDLDGNWLYKEVKYTVLED
jgi:hypothetical protein